MAEFDDNAENSSPRRSSRPVKLSQKQYDLLKGDFDAKYKKLGKCVERAEHFLAGSHASPQEAQDLDRELVCMSEEFQVLSAKLPDINVQEFLVSVSSVHNRLIQVISSSKSTADRRSLFSKASKSSKAKSKASSRASAQLLQGKLDLDNLRRKQEMKKQLDQLEREREEREFLRRKQELERQLEIEEQEAKVKFEEVNLNLSQDLQSEDEDGQTQRSFGRRSSGSQESHVSQVIHAVTKAMHAARAPVFEPFVFSGDSLQFHEWQHTFDQFISKYDIPRSERIFYLKKYTSGEAKSLISGYLMLRSSDAFQEAINKLTARYGNKIEHAEHFRNKLDNWSPMSDQDVVRLSQFSDILDQCSVAMKEIPYLGFLDDVREMYKLSSKLPKGLDQKVRRKIGVHYTRYKSYPKFEKFAKYIREESDILNIPANTVGLQERASRSDGTDIRRRRNAGHTTHLANSHDDSKNSSGKNCQFCKKSNHTLDQCFTLAKKPHKERVDFVRDQKLCFGCLKSGHRSDKCSKRLTCKTCSKRHPTLLHNEAQPAQEDGKDQKVHSEAHTHQLRSGGSRGLTSMILPVYVSTCQSGREVLTYALLDTMSDTSFITEGLRDQLGENGIEAELELTTLTNKRQRVRCTRHNDIQVRGFTSDSKIHIPSVYSKAEIPVNRSHIPTPATARKWPHLSHLQNNLVELQECQVGMLIGYNCVSALAPRNFILGSEDEPYGIETKLGWSIVGGEQASDGYGFSNLTHVPVASYLYGRTQVSYAFQSTTRDVTTERMIRLMERDFSDDSGEFYTSQDDMRLKSEDTPEQARKMLSDAMNLCAEANLKLHKISSNSPAVLIDIPEEDRAVQQTTNIEDLSLDRASGILRCTESDMFQFQLDLKVQPDTRRGVLATTASVFDPIGLISPLVLRGWLVSQSLCKFSLKWDDPIPCAVMSEWQAWKQDLAQLKSLQVPRCVRPLDFGVPVKSDFHHFSDASFKAYGCCSYIRLENAEGRVHCALIMSKARVAPLKTVSMPRLELQAAVLASKVANTISKEMEYPDAQHYFWSDSKVALGYIQNRSTRFHVYVANRVEQIHSCSKPEQWKYVPTDENPADHASRGLSVDQLQASNWFTGPEFLWKDVSIPSHKFEVSDNDPEVKSTKFATTFATQQSLSQTSFEDRCSRFSSLDKLLTAFAVLIQGCASKMGIVYTPVEARKRALALLILKIQGEWSRQDNFDVKSHTLACLDPFHDDLGLMRVGGRLKKSSDPFEVRHPVILPKKSHLSHLVAKHMHTKHAHQGRNIAINQLRSEGFWIIGCRSVVSSIIRKCNTCIKARGQLGGQRMADLPVERLQPSPPFTHCGLDIFGPFLVQEGRKVMKRYGLLFTCLALRAVHIEVLDDLSTDAFINGLRACIAIRGNIQVIYCDNGTNFKGAHNELQGELSKLDTSQIASKLLKTGCDFRFNPPSASHMGGIWERQIKTAKDILRGLIGNSASRLDTSSLRTLMHEVSAIINSRPLTTESLENPLDPVPLTPNHVLTMKGGLIPPPPGDFVKEDLYLRKRWKRVQYLADQFWTRWRKEFLQILQSRSKWHNQRPNLKVDDIVIIQDECPRTEWKLARVIECFPSDDGLVRKVKLLVATARLDNKGKPLVERSFLERPVHKLVRLVCDDHSSGH